MWQLSASEGPWSHLWEDAAADQTLVRRARGLLLRPFSGGRLPARTPLSPTSNFTFPDFCIHISV